jgi:hypothetical protein
MNGQHDTFFIKDDGSLWVALPRFGGQEVCKCVS